MGTTFGISVPRLEDNALLRGQGRFVDDIKLPGTLEAAFVRSPHAHATIKGIDASAALAVDGVHAVYTLAELLPHVRSHRLAVGLPSPSYRQIVDRPILADGEVVYVGEPVAIVIATNRYIAEDAANLVEVDYEPLPAVSSARHALDAGSPRVHTNGPHNLVAEFAVSYGDSDVAFKSAPRRLSHGFSIHRGGSHSIEGRGLLARFEPADNMLTVWNSTQTPHTARRLICETLGLEESCVRVVTPDIGGGFGPKLVFYPEEAVVSLAARLLGRPVKWIEDRREHFISSTQERDQFWDVEIAYDDDARILGVRGTLLHEHGAYTARGVNVPYGSLSALPLAKEIPT
jgi:carbon-monoxide dehydrogenase large subunit